MILTLIMGALGGWGAKMVETKVAEALYRILGQEYMISDQDRSAASLLLCLFLASLVLTFLGLGGHAVLFILAATLGFFQEELREFILNRRD